jgi:hypothetical protein
LPWVISGLPLSLLLPIKKENELRYFLPLAPARQDSFWPAENSAGIFVGQKDILHYKNQRVFLVKERPEGNATMWIALAFWSFRPGLTWVI